MLVLVIEDEVDLATTVEYNLRADGFEVRLAHTGRAGLASAKAWYVPWLCEANYIDAQAMLRKDTWERHGGYRTDDVLVFGWEDWELWLRLAEAGEHGVHVPQMLGRYRTQAESMITTTNLVADHMAKHLRELHPGLPWPP